MTIRAAASLVVLLLGALIAGTPPLHAQAGTPVDTLGWHVVQDGETLESITRRYLGTGELWPENHRLNPWIDDPNRLWPGQRLRIITERQIPRAGALVAQVRNEVDKNLARRGWIDASRGDALRPRDALRTSANSSAQLTFDDGAELVLTEYSQIFLKGLDALPTGVKRGTIEIARGQADFKLDAPKRRAERSEIELVIGDTVARPRPGDAAKAETRARASDDGKASLMVYGGRSEVEAAGQTVAVAQGEGTTVTPGEAPTPPERLLKRPALRRPAERDRFDYANPAFRWNAVDGAARYVLEICQDAECGALVQRVADLGADTTTWRSTRLPAEALYWRVTAVAASGLDGYPSRSVPFTIARDATDVAPPVVLVGVVGAGGTDADGALVVEARDRLRLFARDDASGVRTLRYRWAASEPWTPVSGRGALALEHDVRVLDGATRLHLQVEDALGQTADATVAIRSAG
ncbi:MAG: LysM peptidoglycan-binding domain-containing protein [Acidobacteriota bacterium]